MKFQNSKRRLARHRGVLKWGSLAFLALLAVAIGVGIFENAHLPSFDLAAGFAGSVSLGAVPVLGAMSFGPQRMFFLEAEKGGGGGGAATKDADDDVDYQPKDDFEKAVLASAKKLSALQKAQDTELKVLKEAYNDLAKNLLAYQKNQLTMRPRSSSPAAPGEVSVDAAKHLAAICLGIALKNDKFTGRNAELAEQHVREMLGAEWKAALTTSDIPLPVEYSGEVIELVSRYGTARKYGTVYPLGAGSVKLPRLGTDPAFGLIAMSGSIGEKSPTIVFVTFSAEKFGGIIRLPSEIDEDSIVSMGQFLARYAARQIALVEDLNFWVGTGAGSGAYGAVKGLTYSVIDNSKVVQMASTKTHYSDATLSNFRALRAVPDEAVYGMAAYFLHPSFEQLLSSFNTAGDRPYNPNAQIAGVGANPITTGPTLDGFPIRWINTLPAYSTSANTSKVFALFGDPSFQYLGLRGGLRFDTSKEAGFTTDEILVRALERFTIGLMATGAVAGLETAAS